MSGNGLFGYIDPMSGTLLIQAIIAIAVGSVAFFRKTIWAVMSWVFRGKASDEQKSPG